VIGAALASTGVRTGDTIRAVVKADGLPAAGIPLTVTGIFRPVDTAEAYWGPLPAENGSSAVPVGVRLGGDVVFTPLVTLSGLRKATATGSVDYLVSGAAMRRTDPQLLALAYEQARKRLAPTMTVESRLRTQADRTWNDQQFMYVGVSVAAVQLLLLCWIALFLAVQLTADARRTDLGLLKMRGARRRDAWTLTIGQSALPMVLGGVVGPIVGRYLAGLTVGEVVGTELRQQAWYATLGAAALAVAGAVVAAILAERASLSQSVAALTRKVTRRRHSWAANTFDAVIVVLALGGAYEAREQATADGQVRGLTLIAPVLVALAVGLIAARLLPRLAAVVARPALRTGRLGIGLTAMNLARRPILAPVFALLILVVAVFFGTALSWDVATRARADRAAFETGADRVLTVAADNVSALLTAVRAVDPDGRYAMAAVENTDAGVLAVDAPRLRVSHWDEVYGLPRWDRVAGALHPGSQASYLVRGDDLRLDVTWRQPAEPAAPVNVVVALQGGAGRSVTVTFGPMLAGRHVYAAAAAGCGEAAPCRVASIALSGTQPTGAPAGTGATVHELRIGPTGPTVIGQATFGDRTRWRAGITSKVQVPDITSGPDGLGVAVGATTVPHGFALNAPVYPFDAPSALPAIVAGDKALGGSPWDPRIRPFPGSDLVAVQVTGTANAIPRLGSQGVLVDLEYALRDADVVGDGSTEVWLAADAPDGIVTALAGHGVRVVDDDAIADRLHTLQQQGPAVALRFALLVALVGLVLGVGAFALVAAVERGPRAGEFAALRRQGMRLGVVRTVSYGGYLIFVTLAVALGVATAVSWRSLDGGGMLIFADDWAGLPVPTAGSPTLGLATLAQLALVLATATPAAGAPNPPLTRAAFPP
jgi:putative ABC transport system permease protein